MCAFACFTVSVRTQTILLLVLADLNEGELRDVIAEIAPTCVRAVAVATNVADETSMDNLAQQSFDEFGQVHVVCNNAGVAGTFLGSGAVDYADWKWVMDVNFWGVVHGHRVFLPHLLEHGEGHIVNTASMAGHFPAHSAYGASKWAVVGITEGLYLQLSHMGSAVGVSCLCPGWVATNIANSIHERPEHVSGKARLELSAEDDAAYSLVTELVRNGLAPDHVADLVHDAVLANQFWIFTHADMQRALESRFESIRTGSNPIRRGL